MTQETPQQVPEATAAVTTEIPTGIVPFDQDMESTAITPLIPQPLTLDATLVEGLIPPSSEISPSRGKRLGAFVAGTAVLISGYLTFLHNPGEESRIALPAQPGVTAAPAPTETTLPQVTEAPKSTAPTSTLVERVELSPATTTPTTLFKLPAAEKPAITTPTTVAAESKVQNKSLTEADIAILNATGFEGLKGRNLEATLRFDSATGYNVLVSVDGAELSEATVKQLKSQIKAAEALAASNPSFTSTLKLGPDTVRDITFNVYSAPEKTHYFVFAKGDITRLALPKDVSSFPHEYTQVVRGTGATVTVNKLQPEGSNVSGFDAQNYYNGVGVYQAFARASIAKSSVDMLDKELPEGLDTSYVANPNIAGKDFGKTKDIIKLLGQELAANGAARMDASARAGKAPHTSLNPITYSQALRSTAAITFEAPYQLMEAHFPATIMSAELYANTANS